VLPRLRTACWDHKNPMLCRSFQEYSRAKLWKIRIPGRPNHGIHRNRGWAANPNTSDRSRDGPHLCPASPLTSPSTQASVRLFNELKYISTLETLHCKHLPYAKGPASLVTDWWEERTRFSQSKNIAFVVPMNPIKLRIRGHTDRHTHTHTHTHTFLQIHVVG
jgi:hypothetical protein